LPVNRYGQTHLESPELSVSIFQSGGILASKPWQCTSSFVMGDRILVMKRAIFNFLKLLIAVSSKPHPQYSSRKCPACGGAMSYHPVGWGLHRRYKRACGSCDYADPLPVKMVNRL
jgi:hypothetical protein